MSRKQVPKEETFDPDAIIGQADLSALRDFFKWDPPSWYSMGACYRVPNAVDLLYSQKKKERDTAKFLWCSRCPVAEACLGWAIDQEYEGGIWGGFDGAERERIAEHWIIRSDREALSVAIARAILR